MRVLIILIGRAIVAGQFPKAERLLAEYRELGHLTGQSEAEWVFAVQLSCLRLEQGRLDREVLSLLDATARDVDVPLNDSLLAVAACEVGEDAEARAALNCQTLAARFDLYELLSLTNVVAVHLRDTVHVERLAAVLHLYAAQAIPFAAVPTPSVATSGCLTPPLPVTTTQRGGSRRPRKSTSGSALPTGWPPPGWSGPACSSPAASPATPSGPTNCSARRWPQLGSSASGMSSAEPLPCSTEPHQ